MTFYADSPKASPYLHGNFLVLWNTGVIVLGPPGCGKSEISLQLLDRGHLLVADDLVAIYEQDQLLWGHAVDGYAGWIHVHNLGLMHACNLYPKKTCFLNNHRIDLVIELKSEYNQYTQINPWIDTQLQQHSVSKAVIDQCQQRSTSLLIETLVKGFLT